MCSVCLCIRESLCVSLSECAAGGGGGESFHPLLTIPIGITTNFQDAALILLAHSLLFTLAEGK